MFSLSTLYFTIPISCSSDGRGSSDAGVEVMNGGVSHLMTRLVLSGTRGPLLVFLAVCLITGITPVF